MIGLRVLWLAAALFGAVFAQLEARLHHLHLKVPEPAASMRAVRARVDGTSVILQGLGAGVRVGDRYILFDRGGGEPAASAAEISRRYHVAARWLAERGVTVEPETLDPSALAGQGVEGALDHVGFAVPNLDAAVEALRARGAEPIRRSDDTAMFAGPGGERLEIVRDTDRPGGFWCPMHLDVRSPAAGACRVCGMDLVPIPPPRAGAYRLEVGLVTEIATHVKPGAVPKFAGLQLRVFDPEGVLVTRFVAVHEHPLHLFVVSRDLRYFRHVHPLDLSATADLFDGTFEIPLSELPDMPAGPYMAIADVLPYGATPQTLHRAFVTPGYEGPVFAPPPMLEPGPAEAVVDGVRVRIDAALRARRAGSLRFTFSDAATGAALTDLEPFLGAPAHLLVVSPDLTQAIHAHPEAPAAERAAVAFEPLIPAPGAYKMWVQFQRRGRVSTASFVVRVD